MQSNDPSSRFNWVAGAFFSDDTQVAMQDIGVNFLANAPTVGWFFLPDFLHAVTDGPPFGPGHSAFENWFGVTMDPASDMWSINFRTRDRQLAGFAQGDYNLTDKLKVTAGLRVSNNKLDFAANYASPENNQNSPARDPRSGPAAVLLLERAELERALGHAEVRHVLPARQQQPVLRDAPPRASVRGAHRRRCRSPATRTSSISATWTAAGNPKEPATYKSDSVWSYELGSKNKAARGPPGHRCERLPHQVEQHPDTGLPDQLRRAVRGQLLQRDLAGVRCELPGEPDARPVAS